MQQIATDKEIANVKRRLKVFKAPCFDRDIVEKLVNRIGDQTIIGYYHELKEPIDGKLHDHYMFSIKPDNPWGHWKKEHLDKCTYLRRALTGVVTDDKNG